MSVHENRGGDRLDWQRRAFRVLFRTIAIGTAGLAIRPAAGEAPSNEDCETCHDGAGVDGKDGPPRAVASEAYNASVHGTVDCVACHTDASEEDHDENGLQKVSLEACAECHADEVAAYREGVHARGLDGKPLATCASCHGDMHAVLSHEDPASAAHWSNLPRDCALCHASQAVIEQYNIPVVQPVEAYLEGVHGRAVASGERAAVCSDCHGSHRILPSSDPRSSTWRPNVPYTCAACHAKIVQQYRESVHGVAVARGVHDAPVCTDCHGEHRILAPKEKNSPVFASNLASQTCGRCHSDMSLNAKYGLYAGTVAAFQDSFHGLASRGGRVDVANCASCHGIHNIFPASDSRSLVNPANLPATCGKCHPGAGTAFALGSVHVTTRTTASRAQYWIRFGYMGLIFGLVGFMLLHVGVDFVVKARRFRTTPGQGIERLTRSLRRQHGLVMLSFPLLVYTGFSLTYPEAWWAKPILAWESRFALRGLIHRVAAMVLVAALVWHVAEFWFQRHRRAQLRVLWPALADLRLLRARLLYYAGRDRKLPRAGHITYVEKMEYWAFIWGMVVMTLTGVLLWFSTTTLRFMPKWVTDIATAVHFYEAVLATLAILVWHLYWTMFDPEVYPLAMDWSWWSGQGSERHGQEGEGGAEGEESVQADTPAATGAGAKESEER